MNDQVGPAVAEQLFYVALCVECKPLLTQPFYDESKRDEWAAAHAAIGHVILTATETRSRRDG